MQLHGALHFFLILFRFRWLSKQKVATINFFLINVDSPSYSCDVSRGSFNILYGVKELTLCSFLIMWILSIFVWYNQYIIL